MVLRELTWKECLQMLAGVRLARLACAHENQPYVVPVYLTYDRPSGCLYGFTTPGQKVEWMRVNPLVCVEVDQVVSYDQWVSVVVFGRYEEMPAAPENDGARLRAQESFGQVAEAIPAKCADSRRHLDDEESDDRRKRAWKVVRTHPEWWEPGSSSAINAHHDPAEPFISLYYRIRIDRVTGREATRDAKDRISPAMPVPLKGTNGWLRQTLTGLFGDRSKQSDSAT